MPSLYSCARLHVGGRDRGQRGLERQPASLSHARARCALGEHHEELRLGEEDCVAGVAHDDAVEHDRIAVQPDHLEPGLLAVHGHQGRSSCRLPVPRRRGGLFLDERRRPVPSLPSRASLPPFSQSNFQTLLEGDRIDGVDRRGLAGDLRLLRVDAGGGLHPGDALDHAGRVARQRQEVLALHDEVGAHHLVEAVDERALEALREDGHEDDDPEADHERGGGRRRAPGVPDAVVARQTAAHRGRASAAASRAAPASGRMMYLLTIATATNTSTAPRAMVPSRDVVLPGPYMPATIARAPSTRDDGGDVRREAREARRRQRRALLQRRHGRHARGARGRDDGREQRDDDAHGERDDDRARRQHEPAVRDVDVGRLEEPKDPGGDRRVRRGCRAAEARMPITSASPVIVSSTCRREAPSARSIANSRRRWATVIEKALKMMNAPTSTAMPPNERRTGRRKPPMASLSCFGLVGGRLRAGLDVGVGRQRRPHPSRQRVGRHAGHGLGVDRRRRCPSCRTSAARPPASCRSAANRRATTRRRR